MLSQFDRIMIAQSVGDAQAGLFSFACNLGLPIEVLIEYVQLFRQGDATVDARLELLTEQRRLLQERICAMQNTLARLDYKIQLYESGQMKQCEQRLTGSGEPEQPDIP